MMRVTVTLDVEIPDKFNNSSNSEIEEALAFDLGDEGWVPSDHCVYGDSGWDFNIECMYDWKIKRL